MRYAWVRRLLVRLLSAAVDRAFLVGLALLRWHDHLEPAPEPSDARVLEMQARIRDAIAPPYAPNAVAVRAVAFVEEFGDRSLYVLPDRDGTPAFVLDGNYGPCHRRTPIS